MTNSFTNLGIDVPILKALTEMGFEQPTEVQLRAIPPILNQKDLIVQSKTGSGKTAVFGVSMLQLTSPNGAGPQGLILTPTRELAVQVDRDLQQIAKHLPHKTTAVYGQHSMKTEVQALNQGRTIVTGTPGRVLDHIRQRNLNTKHIRFLVLDEADRMLDMGFIDQVTSIIRTLPKDRVTLLFSATIPPEVNRICRQHMKQPDTITIESETKTVDTIEQRYIRVERNEKRKQLERILAAEQPDSCMIFCNTKHEVDRVHKFLEQKGYASQALHGDIPQSKRIRTIDAFKKGKHEVLVATDVAARGIHIDGLALVVNYDVPLEKDSYIHRIGRTGRTGLAGRAVSLVTGEDIMGLYEIEEHIGALIEEADLPADTAVQEGRRQRRQVAARRPQPPKDSSAGSGSSRRQDGRPAKGGASRSSSRRRRSSGAKSQNDKGSAPERANDKRSSRPPKRSPQQTTKSSPAKAQQDQTVRQHDGAASPKKPTAHTQTKPQPSAAPNAPKQPAPPSAPPPDKQQAKQPLLKRVLGKLLGS